MGKGGKALLSVSSLIVSPSGNRIIGSVICKFLIHILHTGSQEKISAGEGEHRASTNSVCTLGHNLFW